MKPLIKSILSVTAVIYMVICVIIPAMCADLIDTEQTGSLTISITDNSDDKIPVVGAEFIIYRVASISETGQITLTEEFIKSGVSAESLFEQGIAEHLQLYAKLHDIPGTIVNCGEANTAEFTLLPVGVYIVAQNNSLYDYLPCSPFAVSIPTKAADGSPSYNVNASPKVSIRRESISSLTTKLTVTKLWEGGTSHPDITVAITRDGKLHDTVTLNSANNWTHTWDNLSTEYSWFAVETEVPDGFNVSYAAKGHTITMTNHSDIPSPETSSGEEQTTSPPIIDTGLISWPIPILAGAGIVLFAAGYIIFTRRK